MSSFGENTIQRTFEPGSPVDRRLVRLGQADLEDVALEAGLGQVGDDLVRQLLAEHVAAGRDAVVGERGFRRPSICAWKSVSTSRRPISVYRPMRKVPSSPSITSVGLLTVGREDRLHERLVVAAVLGQPAEVAGLGREPGVGGGPRDVLPRLAALRAGRGPAGRDRGPPGGPPRVALPVIGVDRRLDLDHPGVALLGGRRLLDELRVDIRVADLDAVVGRELGHERDVDEPLEGEVRELLSALAR